MVFENIGFQYLEAQSKIFRSQIRITDISEEPNGVNTIQTLS
jgi:hypothetical protein